MNGGNQNIYIFGGKVTKVCIKRNEMMSTPARIFSTMFSFVFTGNQHEALHIIRRFNVKTFFNVEFEHFGWENNFSPIILIFLHIKLRLHGARHSAHLQPEGCMHPPTFFSFCKLVPSHLHTVTRHVSDV